MSVNMSTMELSSTMQDMTGMIMFMMMGGMLMKMATMSMRTAGPAYAKTLTAAGIPRYTDYETQRYYEDLAQKIVAEGTAPSSQVYSALADATAKPYENESWEHTKTRHTRGTISRIWLEEKAREAEGVGSYVPEYFPKQTIDRLLQLTNRGRSYAEKLVTYHDHVVGKVELSEGDERTLFGELEHVKLVYDPQRGYGDIRRGPFTYAARLLIAMVELEHTTRSTTIKESDAVKYAQWMEPRQFSKRPLGQYDNYSYGIEDLIRFRYINKVGEQPLGAPTAETTDHLTQLYPRSKEGCVMNQRPWNATKGTIDVRPDCRAWLFDCSHVALQYRQGGHWYAGTVDKQLRKILLCHTQDIPEHELGVPYHMVEVSYREFLDLGGEK